MVTKSSNNTILIINLLYYNMELYRNELVEFNDRFSYSLNTDNIFSKNISFNKGRYKYFNSVPSVDLDIYANYKVKINHKKKNFCIDLGGGMELIDLANEFRNGIYFREYYDPICDYGYQYYLYEAKNNIIFYNISIWITDDCLNHHFPLR